MTRLPLKLAVRYSLGALLMKILGQLQYWWAPTQLVIPVITFMVITGDTSNPSLEPLASSGANCKQQEKFVEAAFLYLAINYPRELGESHTLERTETLLCSTKPAILWKLVDWWRLPWLHEVVCATYFSTSKLRTIANQEAVLLLLFEFEVIVGLALCEVKIATLSWKPSPQSFGLHHRFQNSL